jgi:hypothetical protein
MYVYAFVYIVLPLIIIITDIHNQHNRPDIIILNKQQKQAYLLDIAVPIHTI